MVCYLTNRSPLAQSVHSFVGSVYARVDTPLLIILVVCLFSATANKYIKLTYKVSNFKLNLYLTLALVCLLIFFVTIPVKVNALLEIEEKVFFKKIILALIIYLKIYNNLKLHLLGIFLNNTVNRIPKNANHLVVILCLFVLLTFNEAPTTTLFNHISTKTTFSTRTSDLLAVSSNSSYKRNITSFQNFYKKSTKHYTYSGKHTDSAAIKQIYQKKNNKNLFFTVDSINITKIYFIITLRK